MKFLLLFISLLLEVNALADGFNPSGGSSSGGNAPVATNALSVSSITPNWNPVLLYPSFIAQGLCNDGTNVYNIATYDRHFVQDGNAPSTFSQLITNGIDWWGLGIHTGDPAYSQGFEFLPVENQANSFSPGGQNVAVAIFSVPSFARVGFISISNYIGDASTISIGTESNTLHMFVTSQFTLPTSSTNRIFDFALTGSPATNIAFVRALQLPPGLTSGINGSVWVNGFLYVIDNTNNAGVLSGFLEQIDTTNAIITNLHTFTQAGLSEYDGLDYMDGNLVVDAASDGSLGNAFQGLWEYNIFNKPTVDTNAVATVTMPSVLDISRSSGYIGANQYLPGLIGHYSPSTGIIDLGVKPTGGNPWGIRDINFGGTISGGTYSGNGPGLTNILALPAGAGGGSSVSIGTASLASQNVNNFANIAIGSGALEFLTAGYSNVVVGFGAMENLVTGSNNIAIGNWSGANLPTVTSSNIDIGNGGGSMDTNVVRLGANQIDTYLAGRIHGGVGIVFPTNTYPACLQISNSMSWGQTALLMSNNLALCVLSLSPTGVPTFSYINAPGGILP